MVPLKVQSLKIITYKRSVLGRKLRSLYRHNTRVFFNKESELFNKMIRIFFSAEKETRIHSQIMLDQRGKFKGKIPVLNFWVSPAMFRIRIHCVRIRILYFMLNTDPDPDPGF
jgi:hypothetical protein